MEKKNFFSGMMGGDNWLWGIYLILCFTSIVEIASASSRLAYQQITNDNPLMRHTMFLVIGFFCLVLTLQTLSSIRTSYVTGLGLLSYIGGAILIFLLPVFGRRVQGAYRDIFGIQPVEFCKVGLIIMLCTLLTARNEVFTRWKYFRKKTEGRRYWVLLATIGLVTVPIALQNLSTALILGIIVNLLVFFFAADLIRML